jgi:hypothetical protein
LDIATQADVVSSRWKLNTISKSATIEKNGKKQRVCTRVDRVQNWCEICACFRSQICIFHSGTAFAFPRFRPCGDSDSSLSHFSPGKCPSPQRCAQQLAQSTAICGVLPRQPLQVRSVHSRTPLSLVYILTWQATRPYF